MGFVRRPMLADHVVCHHSRDPDCEEAVILTGGEPVFLGRALAERLLPLLDGRHGLNDLAARLKGEVAAGDIVAAVQMLARHGAVVDADRQDGAIAFRTARIERLGGLGPDGIEQAFAAAGIEAVDGASRADLRLVSTDHYLRDALSALNRAATGPWLLLRPAGERLWLGPLFRPGEGPCWECLAQRLRHNSKVELFVARERGGALPIGGAAGAAAPAALAAFHAMAAQLLAAGGAALHDTLTTLDPRDMTIERHAVVRRPQCAACGTSAVAERQPPRLDTPVPATIDREAAARATLDEYGYHVSPITGLLPALEPRSNSPGLHVYRGGAYHSGQPRDMKSLRGALRHHAAGKGASELQAKASALAETLEWYTLAAQPQGALIVESATGLPAGARAILPPQLAQYSAAQFAGREAINAAAEEDKYRIPEPFDPQVPIGWLKLWSLTDEEWAYAPGAACCMSYMCPFVKGSSNGNAAGRTIAEAVQHGAMEAVERDAVALWWYNFVFRRRVDPDGVDPSLLDAMRIHYARAGCRFWLLDITSDLGIPAIAALALHEGQERGIPAMGFGAHPDPRIAATRALTELNQMLPRLTHVVARGDRPGDAVRGKDRPVPPHVLGRVEEPPLKLSELPRLDLGEPAEAVPRLVGHLRAHGLEMLVADLTLPDVRLPVVKVLVPGLRQAYPMFGPGRLHEVPLARGWIDRPVEEAAMRELPSPL